MLRQLSWSHDNVQNIVIYHSCMTMLLQLSSPHDNGQSMVKYPLGMKHAPSVVIVSWQRSEYDDTPQVWVMLCQLQRSEHGYLSLRYETCSVSCHRLMTTVRVWWYSSSMSHALSVATVRAWLFIPKVWNMLRQLSSSHDNDQSMVIYP